MALGPRSAWYTGFSVRRGVYSPGTFAICHSRDAQLIFHLSLALYPCLAMLLGLGQIRLPGFIRCAFVGIPPRAAFNWPTSNPRSP
jgi:hypothetical protein